MVWCLCYAFLEKKYFRNLCVEANRNEDGSRSAVYINHGDGGDTIVKVMGFDKRWYNPYMADMKMEIDVAKKLNDDNFAPTLYVCVPRFNCSLWKNRRSSAFLEYVLLLGAIFPVSHPKKWAAHIKRAWKGPRYAPNEHESLEQNLVIIVSAWAHTHAHWT